MGRLIGLGVVGTSSLFLHRQFISIIRPPVMCVDRNWKLGTWAINSRGRVNWLWGDQDNKREGYHQLPCMVLRVAVVIAFANWNRLILLCQIIL